MASIMLASGEIVLCADITFVHRLNKKYAAEIDIPFYMSEDMELDSETAVRFEQLNKKTILMRVLRREDKLYPTPNPIP